MITRRTLGLSLGAATVLAASAHAQAPSRTAEVAALRRFAETTHPRGVNIATDQAWIAAWEALARDADTLSFAQYVMRAKSALALFQDGHTTVPMGRVTGGPFDLRAPLGARPFYDGFYVTAAKDEARPLLGAKLTRIAGVETN